MSHIKIRTNAGAGSNLVRPRPQGDPQFGLWVSNQDKFSAYVRTDVLDFIKRNGDTAAPNETIGLLAGRVCHDPVSGPYTLVMAAENAVPGEFEADPGHVKLKAAGQTLVRRRLEDTHPDREIIGWYHSHPDNAPIFSPVDAREQQTWNDQNSIGIVYSTDGEGAESFGVYRGPDSVRLRPLPNLGTKTAPNPQPSPHSQPIAGYLTPRSEPLKAEENIVTSTPAARLPRVQIAVAIMIVVIWLVQTYGLYRLDRRVAFTEGRLHELTATFSAFERPREQAPVQLSSAASAASQSSASQADGPELHVPVKPLTPAPTPRQQPAPSHSRRQTRSEARSTANTKKRKNVKKATKSETAETSSKDKASTAATTPDPKPANDPKPKATPK